MTYPLLQSCVSAYSRNRISLVKYWLRDKRIIKILKLHDINIKDFVNNYANVIIDLYIKIVKNEKNIDLYHVNQKLINYLKNENISISELFIICNAFKSALIEFAYDLKLINFQFEKEIDQVYIDIFSDLFDKYSQPILNLEKELTKQQNILIEQSKSAVMGEMISMIAHQWRQPLQAVSILAQKLPLTNMMEGKISDELLEQVVDEIVNQLDYMGNTIDDYRDFFLPNKPKELILIQDLIKKSLSFINFMLKTDSISVNICSDENIDIVVNVNEIVQVLINIFKNSKDAFQEYENLNKEINIKYQQLNDTLILEIEDNAGGIQKDVINKVFQRYYSTKSHKNGTGLGLYMSKIIVEKHCNGKISVKNSSKGAIFRIELPL